MADFGPSLDTVERLEEAQGKLRRAENIRRAAVSVYTKNPTRINRINVTAAQRLVEETKAEVEEWTV